MALTDPTGGHLAELPGHLVQLWEADGGQTVVHLLAGPLLAIQVVRFLLPLLGVWVATAEYPIRWSRQDLEAPRLRSIAGLAALILATLLLDPALAAFDRLHQDALGLGPHAGPLAYTLSSILALAALTAMFPLLNTLCQWGTRLLWGRLTAPRPPVERPVVTRVQTQHSGYWVVHPDFRGREGLEAALELSARALESGTLSKREEEHVTLAIRALFEGLTPEEIAKAVAWAPEPDAPPTQLPDLDPDWAGTRKAG